MQFLLTVQMRLHPIRFEKKKIHSRQKLRIVPNTKPLAFANTGFQTITISNDSLSLILSIMIFNVYKNYLIFIIYCDFSNRMVNSIYRIIISETGPSKVKKKKTKIISMLDVCKMYTEQRYC